MLEGCFEPPTKPNKTPTPSYIHWKSLHSKTSVSAAAAVHARVLLQTSHRRTQPLPKREQLGSAGIGRKHEWRVAQKVQIEDHILEHLESIATAIGRCAVAEYAKQKEKDFENT